MVKRWRSNQDGVLIKSGAVLARVRYVVCRAAAAAARLLLASNLSDVSDDKTFRILLLLLYLLPFSNLANFATSSAVLH